MSEGKLRALAVAAALAALASPTPALAEVVRLVDLEARALRSRGALQASQARVAAGQARVDLAGAPLRPTLGAGAQVEAAPGGRLIRVEDTSGDEYLVSGSRPLGDQDALAPDARYGATLSLEQRIHDFGRTSSAVRAAEAEVTAARAGADAQKDEIVLEVRAAYLGWLLAHGTRDILRRNAEDAVVLRETVEARVAEGIRPGSDVAAARYQEVRAALDLSRADAQLSTARLALARAVDGELPASAEPDLALLDQGAPRAAPGPVTEKRVTALERQRDAALAQARAADGAHAPVLSAGADAGVRGQMSTVFPVYRAFVSLKVPLLDGGVSSASAQLARARAAELSSTAREARSRAALERAQTEADLAAAEVRLKLARELEAAAEQAKVHAEDDRALGTGALEGVIQARGRIASARVEVLGARVARSQAALRLAR